MESCLEIHYRYYFRDGRGEEFAVLLDTDTLTWIGEKPFNPPHWTKLEHEQCTNCPFTPEKTPYCPIAINMFHIVERFKEFFSYEDVDVTVTTEERIYRKQTSLQQGLSSLIGIIMVSSGCPRMEKLKPMVRFHLPFASLEETVYRTVAMYLVSQYYLNKSGVSPDLELTGLEELYGAVGEVNTCFANRLREAAKKDANLNALVNLHCFAEMVPLSAEEMLEQIKGHFSAFF